MLYSEDQKRNIKYLLRRMNDLKNGQTLSAQTSEGYPFHTYIDRFGKYIYKAKELEKDWIYNCMNQHNYLLHKVDLIELAWQYYLVYGTPNGDIYKHNSLFNSINHKKGLTILHSTTNLDHIIKKGVLYPSGGCLGASVYGVPLRAEGKMHNLSKFILQYELPGFIKNNNISNKIRTIGIHIENENFIHSNEESNGIDYLLMGKLQKDIYELVKMSIAKEINVFDKLEAEILSQIIKTSEFLNLCVDYKLDSISEGNFINQFEKAIIQMPFLGYIYFEVLVEYISLFQEDDFSLELKEQGELNNWNYKKMVFELSPNLFKSFRLVDFHPKVEDVVIYLKRKASNREIFNKFREDQFLDFFKWRLSQYIRYKLMHNSFFKENINIENIKNNNPSLFGHLVHREIRMNQKLFEYSGYYDKKRAKVIWKGWNKEKIVYPYNSILPKGETGINPWYQNLDYKIYEVKPYGDYNYLKITNELQIKLDFRLINPEISIMRSPYKDKFINYTNL